MRLSPREGGREKEKGERERGRDRKVKGHNRQYNQFADKSLLFRSVESCHAHMGGCRKGCVVRLVEASTSSCVFLPYVGW